MWKSLFIQKGYFDTSFKITGDYDFLLRCYDIIKATFISEITAKDVVDWQNAIRKMEVSEGQKISPTYLKTIHAQLSAIFNHAIRYYDLSSNPAKKAGTMGTEESKEKKN